ncbi:hypothetical protein [Streptosporangium sp. NPDC049376]|uniref:hypothetical protein n=1 Tax=Streptosporangium sp. NPDC049376 TaxID=3366192 RepID=UPI0037A8BAEB
MPGRVLTLLSGAVLAASAALTVAAPAQAAVVERGESPITTGEYCIARIDSRSVVGLYERGSLNCYGYVGGRFAYLGTGNAYDACRSSNPGRVIVGVKEGLPSHYLICLVEV